MRYLAYGHILRCNLELPLPLYYGEIDPEIIINMQKASMSVPKDFIMKAKCSIEGNGAEDNCLYYEKDNNKWICYKSICDFLIDIQSDIITCFYRDDMNIELAILYLLSDVFSTWLRTRREYAFHAASMVVNDKNIMICADKGTGKSTTLVTICNCGGKVISDDITPVRINEGKVFIKSSFPYIKLNPHQYTLANNMIDSSQPVLSNSLKKNCHLKNEFFHDGMNLLDGVFVLAALSPTDNIKLTLMSKKESFIMLVQTIFCGVTSSVDEILEYQKLIKYMISQVPVYHLGIPHNLMLLPRVSEIIKNSLMVRRHK